MRLTGTQLLAKIKFIHGSYDLLTYKGNIRDILLECNYIREDYPEDRCKRAFWYFIDAYRIALTVSDIFQHRGSIYT